MKKLFTGLCAAFLLFSCQSGLSGRSSAAGGMEDTAVIPDDQALYGTWQCVDVQGGIRPKLSVPGMPDPMDNMREILIGSTISYHPDGTFSSQGHDGKGSSGNYRLEGRKLVHSDFISTANIAMNGEIGRDGDAIKVHVSKENYLGMIRQFVALGGEGVNADQLMESFEAVFDIGGLTYTLEKIDN